MQPLCTPYRAWQVCGPQLPSSGGVTTQEILGILGAFDLPRLKDRPAEAIHLFVEANRLAFADRNLYLGDPEFVAAPVGELLAPAYLRERAALIDPKKALPNVVAGTPLPRAAWEYVSTSGSRPGGETISGMPAFSAAGQNQSKRPSASHCLNLAAPKVTRMPSMPGCFFQSGSSAAFAGFV